MDKEIIGEIFRSYREDLAVACDLLIAKALESGIEDNVRGMEEKRERRA